MLPVARGANGQPPMPPIEASKTVAPASSAAYAFAKPVLRVLCRWTPTGTPRPALAPQQVLDLVRHADADRVGVDDLGGAGRGEALGEGEHRARLDRALERAPERGAERDRGADPVLARARENAFCRRDRLLDRDVRVLAAEALRDRDGEVRLGEPGRREPLVAALVEDEAREDDAGALLERGDDLLGARHLRHARGTDEARPPRRAAGRPPRACCRAPRAPPARASAAGSGGRRADRRRRP